MVSRVTFLECGGNSAPIYSKEPIQANVQALHGLMSCAEWTGVKLSTLFEEAGIDPATEWFLAEGAAAPTMHRSIPVRKAMDEFPFISGNRSRPPMPPPGTPASGRTASGCHPAAARTPKAPLSTRRNVPCVMATRAKAN